MKNFILNNLKHSSISIYAILIIIFSSCSEQAKDQDPNLAKQKTDQFITEVEGQVLEKRMFTIDILSNSKLKSKQMADLNFASAGIISNIYVSNGQNVKKGKLLAELDDRSEKLNYLNSKEAYNKSVIDYTDKLLSFGYSIEDTAKVPKDILYNIKISSGYNTAINNLKSAKIALDNKRIYAPFSGVVAGLEAMQHNSSSNYKIFCKLLNNDELLLRFQIMEADYHLVTVGDGVEISPVISNEKLEGKVTSIDPFVNDNGMVEITAIVKNTSNKLISGMNVDVVLKKDIEKRILIEKSAVLDRQNKKVVFKYVNGEAQWNYVTITGQNSKYYSIESDLKVGDTVIIGNNLNLAHETKCKMKELLEY